MSNKPAVTKEENVSNKQTSATSQGLTTQMPLYQNIWDKAGAAAVNTPTDWIADVNAMQRNAVTGMAGVAPTLDANAGSLRDVAGKVASGYFLDPMNDPTFQAAASAAINPITRQLTEKVLPQITDMSIRNGGVGGGPAAYGGARQDIQENQAVQNWTETAGDLTSKMANASRENALKLIPQAGQMDAAATVAALQPSQVLGSAGTQQQAYDQMGVDEMIKSWMASLQGAQQGASVLSTGGFGNRYGTEDSTGTTTKTGAAPDPMTQWLQGIAGVASMATGIGAIPGLGALGAGLFGPGAGVLAGGLPLGLGGIGRA